MYNFALFLLLLITLVKELFQGRLKGRPLSYFKRRLGFSFPLCPIEKRKDVIWIHAPSVGESRAVIPLVRFLTEKYPTSSFIFSTSTLTGLEEVKRSLPRIDVPFLLPFDFSWVMKKYVRYFSPKMLLLVEGDFWLNLVKQVDLQGGKVILINGKVSKRSFGRYAFFQAFTKAIFRHITHFCVQSTCFQERFEKLGVPSSKITVTGNLKFDNATPLMTEKEKNALRQRLCLTKQDRVVVVGSTHPGEEEELLSALNALKNIKILLVPRHPERFESVFTRLKETGEPIGRYTQPLTGKERVILIDAMGILSKCYQIANLAIVAGSFSSKIGGHNIVEPVLLGTPVLFGPAMQAQQEMKELVLEEEAGACVSSLHLGPIVSLWLKDQKKQKALQEACLRLKKSVQGSSLKTLQVIIYRE